MHIETTTQLMRFGCCCLVGWLVFFFMPVFHTLETCSDVFIRWKLFFWFCKNVFQRCSASCWPLGVTTDPGEKRSFVSVLFSALNLYKAENNLYARTFVLSTNTHTYRLYSTVSKQSSYFPASAKSSLLTAEGFVFPPPSQDFRYSECNDFSCC